MNETLEVKKPIILRVDSKLRLEVDKNHYYNSKCKCMCCLGIWLGVSSGDIIVMSPDGKSKMTFPREKGK